jgi:ABC-type phosphate transport system permease subunit
MSLEEVEIMTVVAAVIALPLGILVAWWIWHRWKESVI